MTDRRQGERRTVSRGGRRLTDAPKVPCPFCAWSRSKVVDTRPAIATGGIRRVRECLNPECRQKFHTIETLDAHAPEKTA